MQQIKTVSSVIPLLIVLIPLVGAGLLLLTDRYRPRWRTAHILTCAAVPLLLVATISRSVSKGIYPYTALNILPPEGFTLMVDKMAYFMILLFTFFSLVLVLYTVGYYQNRPEGDKFYYFYLIALSGCFGVALSHNLFTFFLFFELMSLMFFPLVAFKSTDHASAAGLKFFFMTIIAGVAIFWSVVIIQSAAGSVTFVPGGIIDTFQPVLFIAFIGFLVGFGIKAAIVPLHFWMADAYDAAPVPAAALSSTMMLKTGALGLIRVFYEIYGLDGLRQFNWHYILLVLAITSMLYGSINAFAQDNLNRRLAYSGIAQVGYILLGLALLTEQALIGSIYHIMAHAFMKGCMFLCAGVIYVNTGKVKISEMKGIGLQMPVTMAAFTLASVSSVGIPPMNLFVSKWHLGLGAIEAGLPVLIVFLLLSSMLNASYYFPIAINAFLGCRKLDNIELYRIKVEPLRIIPVIILALGAIIFTITPYNWPLSLARDIAGLYYGG